MCKILSDISNFSLSDSKWTKKFSEVCKLVKTRWYDFFFQSIRESLLKKLLCLWLLVWFVMDKCN